MHMHRSQYLIVYCGISTIASRSLHYRPLHFAPHLCAFAIVLATQRNILTRQLWLRCLRPCRAMRCLRHVDADDGIKCMWPQIKLISLELNLLFIRTFAVHVRALPLHLIGCFYVCLFSLHYCASHALRIGQIPVVRFDGS